MGIRLLRRRSRRRFFMIHKGKAPQGMMIFDPSTHISTRGERSMPLAHTNPQGEEGDLLHRLWIYSNYDCNLSCSYCVAESFVGAERKGLPYPQVCRLIDEAATLGITELFLTGGEPFILPDIFPMLSAGLERMQATVLRNGI